MIDLKDQLPPYDEWVFVGSRKKGSMSRPFIGIAKLVNTDRNGHHWHTLRTGSICELNTDITYEMWSSIPYPAVQFDEKVAVVA